ncbi:MAG: hypothetical protein WED00_05850 [Aquisalimonadaceae bacterium]
MPRKPVHLTADARRPEGRQVIWEAIRRLKRFTTADLEHATRVKMATIRTYVEGLTNAGYLQRVNPPRGAQGGAAGFPAGVWELLRDVGVEAPRVRKNGEEVTQGRGREQMWRTMRIIGEFNYHELAVQASTEEQPVAPNEANYYCLYLQRAGYLHCIAPGGPNRAARYRLLPSRYTGPQAPQIQRVRQVWDPNLEQVVWRPEEGGHD